MLYIINKAICFRDSDGSVWTYNDDDEDNRINLTATTSRLLTHLIERQGGVCPREDILENVWLSYGLRSSNNSLNKYIADLRRMFTNMGLHGDIIITVPSVGFLFSRDVQVDREEQAGDEVFTTTGLITENEQAALIHKRRPRKTVSRKVFYVSCSVFLACLALFLADRFGRSTLWGLSHIPESRLFQLGMLDGHQILTLKQNSAEMTGTKLHIAKDMMRRSGLSFLEGAPVYFQPSDQALYNYPGRVFIAKCTVDSKYPDRFLSCSSYYERNYHYEK
ncbi:helix-turn-helix domain-containing protein [Enterobacter asburiae]|uniref:winged helix-turn-helix domain-containing protein n=1 Tax=Enterobacter asburiae TaxID=61645 RepID=UPI002175C0B4|nr:helix-turn-helix domain-containing protein [Enterobacter asburiae]MCS5456947.1 helix-turn-helix domain-containing protein [Enterobacter asburiae]